VVANEGNNATFSDLVHYSRKGSNTRHKKLRKPHLAVEVKYDDNA